MKKNMKIVLIVIAVLLLIGLGAFIVKECLTPKTYTEITFENFKDFYEKDKDFVLFIGSDTCSHCTQFKTVATEVVKKYHVNIYYIDVDKLDEEPEKLAYLKSRFPFNSTPTIYVYKDKKKDHHVGKMNVSETVDFLERNGMLSTDKK